MTFSSKANGYIIGFLGGLALSFDALFINLMNIDDAWLIIIGRGFLMWSFLLISYFLLREKRYILGKPWPTKENILPSICFGISSVFMVKGLNSENVALVLFIVSTTPILSSIVSRILFNDRIERQIIVTSIGCFIGIFIILNGMSTSDDYYSGIYAFITALSMATGFVFSSKMKEGNAGTPLIGAMLASIFVVLFYQNLLKSLLELPTINSYFWMIIEGFLIMPIALGLLTLSSKYISASASGLFLLLESALGPFWIWLLIGGTIKISTFIGGIIIITSLIINSLLSIRRDSEVKSKLSLSFKTKVI